jgi:hypothetical protein
MLIDIRTKSSHLCNLAAKGSSAYALFSWL